jgi:hypothetical protein
MSVWAGLLVATASLVPGLKRFPSAAAVERPQEILYDSLNLFQKL